MAGSETIENHAGFSWSVADLLRGDHAQSEYGKVACRPWCSGGSTVMPDDGCERIWIRVAREVERTRGFMMLVALRFAWRCVACRAHADLGS
jgi:hypothetical protein